MRYSDLPHWDNSGGLLLAVIILVLVVCLVQIARDRAARRNWKRGR